MNEKIKIAARGRSGNNKKREYFKKGQNLKESGMHSKHRAKEPG